MLITLWKKDSGNFLSHRNGLTQDQVDQLHNLKAGDRIMVSPNHKRKGPSDYDIRIVKFETKEEVIYVKSTPEDSV